MNTNIQSEVNTNRSYARVWEMLLHLHNLEPSVLVRTSDQSLRKNVASKERVLKKKKSCCCFLWNLHFIFSKTPLPPPPNKTTQPILTSDQISVWETFWLSLKAHLPTHLHPSVRSASLDSGNRSDFGIHSHKFWNLSPLHLQNGLNYLEMRLIKIVLMEVSNRK